MIINLKLPTNNYFHALDYDQFKPMGLIYHDNKVGALIKHKTSASYFQYIGNAPISLDLKEVADALELAVKHKVFLAQSAPDARSYVWRSNHLEYMVLDHVGKGSVSAGLRELIRKSKNNIPEESALLTDGVKKSINVNLSEEDKGWLMVLGAGNIPSAIHKIINREAKSL